MSDERLIIEKMFRIPDKDGNDVDFLLNDEQAYFDDHRTGRDIVPKARQLGISTYVLGLFLARCLMYRNRNCVLISHDTVATQKLLQRIHYIIKHMKGAKPDLAYANQNFITFKKMDSSIRVGTAGSDDFGVGDTITDLHCSEVSRWSNPGPLLSGLFQAVPTNGTIIIESTGRGVGNYFHRAVMGAREEGNDSGFRCHFFNWLNRPEYRLPVGEDEAAYLLANLRDDLEESYYVKNFGLTAPQIKWRRRTIAELDGDLQEFKEQYPVDLDECFQATGSSFFPKINYVPNPDWKQSDAWTWRLEEHPMVGHVYSAGVDPAGGVALDNSTLCVWDIESGEQVLEYANKRYDPVRFADACAEILRPFGAYVNYERNNHGFAFGARFLAVYPKELVHKTRSVYRGHRYQKSEMEKLVQFGSVTTEVSKPLIIGKFRTKMRLGEVVIYSEALRMECSSFVETERGHIEAAQGCLDDRVMAAALGVYVFEAAAAQGSTARAWRRAAKKRAADTFAVDSILAELEGRYSAGGGNLPISDQLSADWL